MIHPAIFAVPPPRFPRKTPADRWLSEATESVPGGQPVPDPADSVAGLPDNGHRAAGDPGGDPAGARVPPLPRWARCPVDRHLHLLAPAEAQAAGIEGHGRAGCGRLIPRAGLTIDGASVAGWCVSCLTVGTAR
ncbi:MAG: hypothetical protein ACRDTJ_01825 [Pseudonocardiaceae bacterium]